MHTPDLFPLELAAAQAELAASAPYEPHCIVEDEFFDDADELPEELWRPWQEEYAEADVRPTAWSTVMDTDLSATLLDIARSGQPCTPPVMRRGRQLIAGFASARDAQVFATIKREEGQDVAILTGHPDSPYLFEVHTVVRSL